MQHEQSAYIKWLCLRLIVNYVKNFWARRIDINTSTYIELFIRRLYIPNYFLGGLNLHLPDIANYININHSLWQTTTKSHNSNQINSKWLLVTSVLRRSGLSIFWWLLLLASFWGCKRSNWSHQRVFVFLLLSKTPNKIIAHTQN